MLTGSAAVLIISLWLSFQLRYDFRVPDFAWEDLRLLLLWIVPLKLLVLSYFGQLDALPGFFGWADVKRIALALSLVGGVLLILNVVTGGMSAMAPPRSVAVIDTLLGASGLFLLRYVLNRISAGATEFFNRGRQVEPVVVVGAGEAGAMYAQSIRRHSDRRKARQVLFFLDDDPSKRGSLLHGFPVLGAPDRLADLREKHSFRTVIIAMPSAHQRRIRQLIRSITETGCRVEVVPHIADLASGMSVITDLHTPQIEDVLGRPEVVLDQVGIQEMLRGQRVLITGAGGSIGYELASQIAATGPDCLILLERSEYALYRLEEDLRMRFPHCRIEPRLLDLNNISGVEALFGQHKPGWVFHAAAHKHVPITEREPFETLSNNTVVTCNLVDTALRHHCRRFVFISTDKAVKPANILGASKRLAEMYLQTKAQDLLASAGSTGCKLLAVRFGNVLGSSGSVIPLFQQQIAKGGPVTVTDPDTTRFFMTLREAVGLILQCALQAEGGEIFVLDMGDPVRIQDLARQMIQLSGFQPDIDIPIQFIGLRPGEKLHEDLHQDSEKHESTRHPRILRFLGTALDKGRMEQILTQLKKEITAEPSNPQRIRQFLTEVIGDFRESGAEPARTEKL